MENNRSAGRTQAKSARRALDLLEALAAPAGGRSFGELAGRLELPKSSLHELLDVLTARGYVAYDPATRAYGLGVRVWELGQAFAAYRELVGEAQAVMEGIVRTLNETVQLSVLDGVENVYLAKVDCTHAIRLASQVGKRLPAHATGLGKVLLAYLPPEERARRLAGRTLGRYTAHTIADPTALADELATIRRRGFAVDNEEYTPDLRCVAVPVRDRTGQVTAAISAPVPIMRATPARLALALRLLAEGSLEIGRRLGGPGEDRELRRLAALSDAEREAAVAAVIVDPAAAGR